ncbi:MAG: family 43 glycosylhydrolase [Chitinivibrionales bacterium]|nr:family 43 glycosylhydrolase [Chitinivibrionales bacterium]
MLVPVYTNPVLPGFYPDPSLCRVDDDYYLVTSSFEYFPGVPVFHSKDLVNWRQIGHVLNRPSQLDLDMCEPSRGIWAATIRYHGGTFYICTTNVCRKIRGESMEGGNFIVTAVNPAGPWSEPHWLDNACGIDPSLFFDDDGRAWFAGTGYPPNGPRYKGNNAIWLQELDIEKMEMAGPKYYLWEGALADAARHTEGPHIYKTRGYYYLMVAEGGTGYAHAITVARSRQITGPYENNPRNPIITHRHMGNDIPITNVGHGDLVQTQNGEWWLVLLGSRPYGGLYRNLGRETFLAPVSWLYDWPIVSPGCGRIEFEYQAPDLPQHAPYRMPDRDGFDAQELALCYNFLRTPRERFWNLDERVGFLRLRLRPERIAEHVNPSFVGRRQQHIDFHASCKVEFEPDSATETAGLVLLQNSGFHFRVEICQSNEGRLLRLTKRYRNTEDVLASVPAPAAGPLVLAASARGQELSFMFGSNADCLQSLAEKVDSRILSTEIAGGFTGTYIGMYASSNGAQSENCADFDWFEYRQG